MPQVKTKTSGKTGATAETTIIHRHPSLVGANDLFGGMLEYEAAARDRGMDFASGPFTMLTASERQFYRAELIAAYIRLSVRCLRVGKRGIDDSLTDLCLRICDMATPPFELVGTYLAAIDVAAQEDSLKNMDSLDAKIRSTANTVARTCAEIYRGGTRGIASS